MVWFNKKNYKTALYNGQVSKSRYMALDTETDMIVDEQVPTLRLMQVTTGQSVLFVEPADAARFMADHVNTIFIAHNAPFDMAVLHNHGIPGIYDRQWYDTGIIYQLLALATKGVVPERWGLQTAVQEVLGIYLEKEHSIRCGDWNNPTPDMLDYAALDAAATWELFWALQDFRKYDKELSHDIQLRGATALHDINIRGIGFDLGRRDGFLNGIQEAIAEALLTLAQHGYIPGQKGVNGVLYKLCEPLDLPKTKTGRPSTGAETLEPFRDEYPWVDALLTYKELDKLASFVREVDKNILHPRYTNIKATGRTSCSKPNVQNLPRRAGVRECFIPTKPNHVLIAVDYSQLELCTLAQVCYTRYGFSAMRDAINAGQDLHKVFAASVFNVDIKDVTKQQRQLAKAFNFGKPGGLGHTKFVQFAWDSYKVELDIDRAKELHEVWLNTFPEMRLYLKDKTPEKFEMEDGFLWYSVTRLLQGERTTSKGKELHEMAYAVAAEIAAGRDFSPELWREVSSEDVVLPTGFIRAKTDFCAARNTPFQGLAAAGAKCAMYRAFRDGLEMVAFIHDEIIIQAPEDKIPEYRARLERCMLDGMAEVVPDVKIAVAAEVMKRWVKEIPGDFIKQYGHDVPYDVE
jgi:DNA polymerase-1